MRGMGNFAMVQKMQKLQKEMMKAQKNLEESVFERSVANNQLEIKMTGNKRVTDIKVGPDLLDPEDSGMLEDLLVSTLNDLMEEIDKTSEAQLGKYTKGLNLPF